MSFLVTGVLPFLSTFVIPLDGVNAQNVSDKMKQLKASSPNVIIIFTDDQGVNDLGCYGSPNIKTPNIDKLAKEGMRFTNFYVSASVSSASRAGLITGQLNTRNGAKGVFSPNFSGLPSSKKTIADRLKKAGYKTSCFGKWHLGDLPGHMPTDRGFDEYFGIPYSNDMYISPAIKLAPDVNLREGWTKKRALEDQKFIASHDRKYLWLTDDHGLSGKSPLVKDSLIVEYPCDQSSLTRRYFEHAMDFITRSKTEKKPFFCYITPAMPHVPLHASSKFAGTSKRGLYGDCVQEIDYYVGKLMKYLKDNKLDKNTLILFTSDNGPWLAQGEDGGCALPFRDGKFSSYEGGTRMPFIAHWTGKIPPKMDNDNIFSSIDFVPTIMYLADGNTDIDVDGVNEISTLIDPKVKVRDYYLYVNRGILRGIRKGNWIYLPTSGVREGGEGELFNIKNDISQEHNLYSKYPKKVEMMKKVFEKYRKMHSDSGKVNKKI